MIKLPSARLARIIIATASALTLLACQEEYTNAPLLDDARFVAAAPRAATLRLALGAPTSLPNALVDVASWAESYRLTRVATLQLNAVALRLLRDVDDLLAAPPAERSPGYRRWLPRAHALDTALARFEMHEADAAFTYLLEQRRRAAAGDFTAVMTGAFVPSTDGGAGALTLDLSAAAALSGGPERGRLHLGYAFEGPALVLEIGFDAVSFAGEPASDLDYRYERTPAGDGVFDFAWRDDDASLIQIKSRWRPDGAGRADVIVTRAGQAPEASSECWSPAFVSVYAAAAGLSTGDRAACAYADPAFPEPLPQP